MTIFFARKIFIFLITSLTIRVSFSLNSPNTIETGNIHYDSEISSLTLEYGKEIKSEVSSNAISLIHKKFPNYKFYHYSCSQNYTQLRKKEYLIPIISPEKKFIKYILLIDGKNNSYQIQQFGHLELTPENYGWVLTTCGSVKEILADWKSKDLTTEKWFHKPLNNGLGYFCVIRDDSSYVYTCYQYDKRRQRFNRLYGTYWEF